MNPRPAVEGILGVGGLASIVASRPQTSAWVQGVMIEVGAACLMFIVLERFVLHFLERERHAWEAVMHDDLRNEHLQIHRAIEALARGESPISTDDGSGG